MKITSKSIGIRSVLAPLLAAVAVAVLIAVLVPSGDEDGAGVVGVLAILGGAVCVGAIALWSLASAPHPKAQPTIVESQAARGGEKRPIVISPGIWSPSYAAAVTLTVVTLVQAGSFEIQPPTQDESLRPSKAANGTPDPEADQKVGALPRGA